MMILYVMLYVILGGLIILSSSFGQPGIVDFYPLINNKTTNCPVQESDVRLICTTRGTASRMIIKRAEDQKPLYTSPQASTSAEFIIQHVDCVDMGLYQCIIDNIHRETTLLVLPECPPLPCHQKDTNMSVYADVNKPLDIALCVWVRSDILSHIDIDTVRVRRKAEVDFNWTWDYYENKHTDCSRNVTIALKHRHFTTEDYGGMSVRVYSDSGEPFYLDYNISLIPPGSSLAIEEDHDFTTIEQDHETRGDHEAQEDKEALEESVIFMSPFIIIFAAAVVLAVVMIVRKGSRQVLEELPEAQAPENPHYEEIIDFRQGKAVYYANLILSNARDEEVEYANNVNGSHQVLEELPKAQAPENPHYEEIIDFRSDMPGSRQVLEELPEAQAPENPHYEEIIDFRPDMPGNPVYYANLILSNARDEEMEYEKSVVSIM